LEKISVDRRIIVTWIFKKYDRDAWTGLTWLRTGTGQVAVKSVMNLRVP